MQLMFITQAEYIFKMLSFIDLLLLEFELHVRNSEDEFAAISLIGNEYLGLVSS